EVDPLGSNSGLLPSKFPLQAGGPVASLLRPAPPPHYEGTRPRLSSRTESHWCLLIVIITPWRHLGVRSGGRWRVVHRVEHVHGALSDLKPRLPLGGGPTTSRSRKLLAQSYEEWVKLRHQRRR